MFLSNFKRFFQLEGPCSPTSRVDMPVAPAQGAMERGHAPCSGRCPASLGREEMRKDLKGLKTMYNIVYYDVT